MQRPHVILLAPHFPANQLRFLQGLKAVGARVSGIIDAAPEQTPRVVLDLLDHAEFVPSVTSEEAVYQAVRRVQQRGPWVHRLEATVEAHMRIVARVRERTAIPGVSVRTTELCRDKFAMKAFLTEQGFPCAAQRAVSSAEEARRGASELGFPVILKPRDGAGAAGTYKCTDAASLEAAISASRLDAPGVDLTMEEFLEGHEGFFDTLTVGGQVVFEGISHYFPGVLEAMRNRSVNPMIVATNRVEAESYGELRRFGRRVIEALDIGTSATHMEWFFGPKGLKFSEIGARPPGVHLWDIYSECNELDLYTEWARAVCWGDVHARPSRRFAGGLLAIRPTADGVVRGYTGVDEVQRRFGAFIFDRHLPPPGSRTQPVEAGYRANAWLHVKHPDYDACKGIMEEIGRTLVMHAG